jgi:hypothetical protein
MVSKPKGVPFCPSGQIITMSLSLSWARTCHQTLGDSWDCDRVTGNPGVNC